MEKAGVEMPIPLNSDIAARELCAKLIIEEVFETIKKGLGLSILHANCLQPVRLQDLEFMENDTPNMVELADGIGDSKYVLNYTATKFGLNMEPIEAEILRSNNSKFTWTKRELEWAMSEGYTVFELQGGLHRVENAAGKIMKPPGYSKANLAPIIAQQEAA